MNTRASHLARGAAIAALALGSLPLAAQVAEPGVAKGSAGCYVVSGRNDAQDMTIRLTVEAVPDADRFSELPLFEVVALPPENWDGSGEHEVYWSQSANAEMVMVSWLFYDLESSVNLVFRALATGADGPGILSLFSHTGTGSDRTTVSVARTACPE